MNTPTVHFDWDRFHERAQRLRAVHDARTPAEAVAVSLEAFRAWRVPPPATFNETMAAVAAGGRGHEQRPPEDDNQ